MSSKKVTTVGLTVTSASYLMSVHNTDGELVVTIAPIDTSKLSFKPGTDTLYCTSSNLRTASTSALYPSAVVTADLTSFSKSINIT